LKSRFKHTSGFTLIEVLIATVVLASVVALAGTSYSLYLQAWSKRAGGNERLFKEYRLNLLLKSSLESAFDYYVTDRLGARPTPFYPFFLGLTDELSFVTLSSVWHKGAPALARLRLEKESADLNGRRSLIYEEWPLNDRYLAFNEISEDWPALHQAVIFAGAENIKFRYYGFLKTRYQVEREREIDVLGWQGEFSGRKKYVLPRRIEITANFADDQKKVLTAYLKIENPLKRIYYTDSE